MLDKFEIIREVQNGLNNIKIARGATPEMWTKEVKTELCKIGKRLRYYVAARSNEVARAHRDRGEWLYDVTWLVYEGDCDDRLLVDAPLVAECEWGCLGEIYYDFNKLLLARSGVRLMIFTSSRNQGGPRGIAEKLARKVRNFKGYCSRDAWLLVAWESLMAQPNANDWYRFRYFTIDEKGGVQELS